MIKAQLFYLTSIFLFLEDVIIIKSLKYIMRTVKTVFLFCSA